MKVLASGCSFIWGNELSDDTSGTFSRRTWPALWAKENGYEYDCCALPGAANGTIVRRVIDYVENNKPDIVLVQWTFHGRQEFRYQQKFSSERWGNFYAFTPWSMVKTWEEIYDNPKKYPFNRDADNSKAFEEAIRSQINSLKDTCVPDLADIWYKHISCIDSDRYYFFKEISYLKSYLESKSIKYVFTGAESNLFRIKEETSDKSVRTLTDIINSCSWVWFNYHDLPLGFMDWARTSRQKIGSTHPLDSAHENALTLIRNQLNEILKENT